MDPANPTHFVGAWQQDRWSSGSASGVLTAVTFDGGATWMRTALPFSRCAGGNGANGGDYERATDPWVTFAPDGTVYQMVLAVISGSFAAGSASAMLVSRSTDSGRTWGPISTLIRDGALFFNDKNTITADATDARYAYAVWDRLAAALVGFLAVRLVFTRWLGRPVVAPGTRVGGWRAEARRDADQS